jgi:hypothetical protein
MVNDLLQRIAFWIGLVVFMALLAAPYVMLALKAHANSSSVFG